MKRFKFAYTCVNPESKSELEFIDEHMKPISVECFLRKVKIKELNDNLTWGGPYTVRKLKDDDYVKFYRCTGLKDGQWAYICTHSQINHIFKGCGGKQSIKR